MKFTNGFWLLKKEYTADYVQEINCVEEHEGKLYAYGPYKKINGRGDTLNIGMLTYCISSPKEDVIGIRMYNHLGKCKEGPEFELENCIKTEGATLEKKFDGKNLEASSGTLSVRMNIGSPKLEFWGGEKRLTYTAGKTTGMMHHKDGMDYLVTGLNLGVGELVYGLGERFTPIVKNGQSVELWNEDGGTASEISYKNIPFYYTNKGYGIFINHPGKVSLEVGSEKVETVQFSVKDETLEYFVIYGPTPMEIIRKYTALTGRPALPPEWSFGLWLTTSFSTDYDEETVNKFVDGFEERNIPLQVFHFDCFWMKGFEWCNFIWDKAMFPDPAGMLDRLHKRGLKICVWINPYSA